MPLGPGKYDDLCTHVRNASEAKVAIVAVVSGNRGTGFSMQAHASVNPLEVAKLLETMAANIRQSMVQS